ncbi:AI-2E family transporter [Acinetobacter sp. HY1485]|uniref:AI-2E family transporter n=1 Tax=Acinetobacter sp. HY1485 TaxID=2970918 RepID=UPI0022B9C14C|nr:AI-2E family transporter [Acinetobacter sp. HY1485]
MFHRILLFGLFATLIFLSFDVLKYFIIPVVWAMIIAYMTFPIYQWIKQRCQQKEMLSASIMLCLITCVIGLPLILGAILVQHEGRHLFTELQQQLVSGNLQLPQQVYQFPIIGEEAQRIMAEINQNPRLITVWIQSHLSYGRLVFTEISSQLVKLFLALFSLFFFYRDGHTLLNQGRQALQKIIGDRADHYIQTISDTTRAVVYGFGLTALAQAILAGMSYFFAGAPNPVLLTLVTFVLAIIPFGTPVAYTGVALWLFSQGQVLPAIGVMAWGVCVVSTSDNVIRPLVISGATKIPFLLIMFGVLGGIASFGLVGLFIGPVVLAILLATWREWLETK